MSEELDREIKEATVKSVRRDIVIGMAKQIFIALIDRSEKGIGYPGPENCFGIAEVWAQAQMDYCEKNET